MLNFGRIGRNSSVGRALYWRSKDPWFNAGFRHCNSRVIYLNMWVETRDEYLLITLKIAITQWLFFIISKTDERTSNLNDKTNIAPLEKNSLSLFKMYVCYVWSSRSLNLNRSPMTWMDEHQNGEGRTLCKTKK